MSDQELTETIHAVLFSGRAFIETLFFKHIRHIIDVEHVTDTRSDVASNWSDVAVTEIVACHRAVEYAKANDLGTRSVSSQFYNFVAILSFTSVSIVH
jgi:hypothetical protein